MRKMSMFVAVACLGAVLVSAAPAKAADICLQFSGIPFCPIAGSAGFFRFIGAKLPGSLKKATTLRGRACGTGTVYGSAVQVDSPAAGIVLSATYDCAGAVGFIDATFPVGKTPVGTMGGGRASTGDLTMGMCLVAVVDCALEP